MTNCSLDLWIGSHLHSEGALLNQRDFPLESLHTTRALVLSITLPCVTETNVSCPNQPVNFIFCIIRQLRGGHKWDWGKSPPRRLTRSSKEGCRPALKRDAPPLPAWDQLRPTETKLRHSQLPKCRQREHECSGAARENRFRKICRLKYTGM